MKTGEGKTLVATLPSYLNALDGQRRPRRHGQRLPRQVPRGVDGPRPPLPRAERRRDPAVDEARRAARGLQLRHHLRHQQRARLRLPARQHGRLDRGVRPARPPLRGRRRGRLDPDRRGAHPADHQRPHPGRGPVVRRVRQAHQHPDQGRRLRGRREEEDHLGARARHHQGRGPPRHREPLRVGEHPADLVPEQLDQGQGAVPQRQGVRRHGRRGPDRRRAHRPHAGRPPLQRRPAPGDRGQGGRRGPRGVPDPRHGHPAELLPPLREALRDDRYGDDRGQRVRQDLQARRGPDPDQPADGPRRPARPGLPHRGGQVRRGRRRHRRAQRHRPADPGRHRLGREVRAPVQEAARPRHPALRAERQGPRRRGEDRRAWPATRARSRSPPTWPAAAPTSCSAARWSSSPTRSCARRASSPPARPPTSTKRPGPARSSRSRPRSRPSTTRSRQPAASTSSAPSGTSRAASTTSCAVVPAARATPASRGSTSRSRTS